MGAYINPSNMSKEAWLIDHAILVSKEEAKSVALPDDSLYVCWMSNGPFTAAAIAFSDRELEEFMKEDGRPKKWFVCKVESLLTVSPELRRYLKGFTYKETTV